jgi:uncharacterized cupin superfamily protein
MSRITVETNPSDQRLSQLGVKSWPIWTKEVSEFPWEYDEQEICFFLAGDVVVTADDGEQAHFGKGDLVTFPVGLTCTWKVIVPVRKHYKFG